MLTRADPTERVLAAQEAAGLLFKAITERIGRDPVWTTSALLRQQRMDAAEADADAANPAAFEPDLAGALNTGRGLPVGTLPELGRR